MNMPYIPVLCKNEAFSHAFCAYYFHQDNWDEDEDEKASEKDEDVDEENEEEEGDDEEKDEENGEDRDVASEKELNGDSDLDPENESEEEWTEKNKLNELCKLAHLTHCCRVLLGRVVSDRCQGPLHISKFLMVVPMPLCCPEHPRPNCVNKRVSFKC